MRRRCGWFVRHCQDSLRKHTGKNGCGYKMDRGNRMLMAVMAHVYRVHRTRQRMTRGREGRCINRCARRVPIVVVRYALLSGGQQIGHQGSGCQKAAEEPAGEAMHVRPQCITGELPSDSPAQRSAATRAQATARSP